MSCECMKRSKAEMTYDQLNAANNSACNNLAICKEKLFKRRAETTRLRQQLEILKTALKYYADGEHIRHLSNGDCVFEYGDIAQQALAQIRELEK